MRRQTSLSNRKKREAQQCYQQIRRADQGIDLDPFVFDVIGEFVDETIERRRDQSRWYTAGILHREGDQPVIVFNNGAKEWRENGVRHRVGGPAVIQADGCKYWYFRGVLHREDGPAVICPGGYTKWYHNGLVHRLDGPAIRYANGQQEWYSAGVLHREGGPAITYPNGAVEYFEHGVHVAPPPSRLLSCWSR